MNLVEFAALKPGDEIVNLMNNGNKGRVTEAKPDGVMISWGLQTIASFFYSVNSTAWMHWDKVDG